jgi:iron complex outermembrane receptor protein
MKFGGRFYKSSVSAFALAAGCIAFGAPALAQDDALETVVVTATGTNISGIAPVGTESIALDRDAILNTGQTSLSDVVRALPQVTNLGVYREGGTQGGQNATQANVINLRGLGIGGTLTLVNGHRVPSTGTGTTMTDANQLPMAMIEKVEMIVDGNSAIYGSDAVGGVVNFVTRKNFEGIEASARFTAVDGYTEYGGSITAGHFWDHLGGGFGVGNLIVSYDYDWRNRMWKNSRPRLMQNLTQFGGVDNRVTGGAVDGGVGPQNGSFLSPGTPGNIVISSGGKYTYYGVPKGNGTGLTYADLSTTPNMIDLADRETYLGSMFRHQATIIFNQDLSPWATFYFEGLFTKRHTRNEQDQSNSTSANICVPATSPFYIAGIPASEQALWASQTCKTGPSATDTTVPGIIMQYDFSKDDPSWGTDNPDETYAITMGIKAKLPGDWNADISYGYGVDHACGICRWDNNVSFGAFQHQVTLGNINPFSSEPLTEAQRKTFIGSNIQSSHNVLHDFVMKLDGPLFDLPGGSVKAAFGVEYRFESEGLMNGSNMTEGEQGDFAAPAYDNQFVWSNITHNTRSVVAAFAEAFVPVVSEANSVPLIQSLSLDAAVRYDKYSDFGDTINPKIGLTWKVFDDLQARGSWGTSYRAPTVTDNDPYVASYKFLLPYQQNYAFNSVACSTPKLPNGACFTNALILFGSQPGLKPEKSINKSFGFDYTPSWLENFKISTTYYDIHYTNRIQNPPNGEFLTSDANFALYSKYAKAINNTGCVQGNTSTYDPVLRPYLSAVGLYTLYMPVTGKECQVNVVIDARTTNIGTTNQEGIDFNTSYHFDTPVGLVNLQAMVTVVLSENAQYTSSSPVVSRLNKMGYPVAWRGRMAASWMNGPWVANLYMNYVGSYKNTAPLNNSVSTHISDWITFDAGVTYTFDGEIWSHLKDTRLSVNAQNLFDRDPPLVLTNSYASFDPEQANIFGRIVTLQLTKNF